MISNFVGNILTPAGGDIADNVKIILTDNYLYLAYIGHTAIAYAEEFRNIEKIETNKL